uniref:ATP synthase complex subunit 8 n=1 Tax=Annamanum lunulatum TaxID=2717113 RepID=A0A6G7SDB4_9CUCU|nr:ATP synthase F0 subunit 8 [Annamanum lunulatum]QIJ99756.1 ATP synthase F0 subunit 8 [Annamanum lunulatum]
MPQMAPLSWLILMIFFILNFILFNIINYFTFFYNVKSLSKNKISLTYNWKW